MLEEAAYKGKNLMGATIEKAIHKRGKTVKNTYKYTCTQSIKSTRKIKQCKRNVNVQDRPRNSC